MEPKVLLGWGAWPEPRQMGKQRDPTEGGIV